MAEPTEKSYQTDKSLSKLSAFTDNMAEPTEKKQKLEQTSFLNSEEFSDLTLVFSGQSVKVHKVMLCHGSPYFHKLCGEDWKEASKQSVELFEDEPQAVHAMLRHLYQLSYMDSAESWQSDPLPHVHVYAAADKYDVKSLKEAVIGRFKDLISNKWNDDSFPKVVQAVYGSTPPSDKGLRDVVAALCIKHQDVLATKKEFVHALSLTGQLGTDLFVLLNFEHSRVLCPICKEHVEQSKVTQWASNCEYGVCPSCARATLWSAWNRGGRM